MYQTFYQFTIVKMLVYRFKADVRGVRNVVLSINSHEQTQ